jgi:3-dehydroquinate synthase
MNREQIADMLASFINVKASVVEIDPDEKGQRATLNLGHTLGHALESMAINNGSGEADQIRHGYAVALGLAFITKVSSEAFGLNVEIATKILSALKSSGAIQGSRKLHKGLALKNDEVLVDLWPKLSALTTQDKKAKGGASSWVLLTGNGEILRGKDGSWTNQVSLDVLAKAWTWLITWIDDTAHQP